MFVAPGGCGTMQQQIEATLLADSLVDNFIGRDLNHSGVLHYISEL